MNKQIIEYWHNKAAVVTGGARGQGAAEVIRLLKAGATVYAMDILPDTDPYWSELKNACSSYGNRLHTVIADVANEDDWQQLACIIRDQGTPLCALVNNAGITLRKTVTQTSLEEWHHLMSINLTGAYLGIHTLAPLMINGGAIVNISSTAGLTGYFSAAYTTSKWALRGLTRAAAMELADRNIRVNTICPGLIDTPMLLKPNAVHNAEKAQLFYEGNKQATMLSRGADPDEVAAAVMFLLGPDASFITGTDLPVDGGMTGGGVYWRIGKTTGNL